MHYMKYIVRYVVNIKLNLQHENISEGEVLTSCFLRAFPWLIGMFNCNNMKIVMSSRNAWANLKTIKVLDRLQPKNSNLRKCADFVRFGVNFPSNCWSPATVLYQVKADSHPVFLLRCLWSWWVGKRSLSPCLTRG